MSQYKQINAHMHIGGGSHLPILSKIMNMTEGPVLELGMGLFSTPYLHWACFDTHRQLVSYENKRDFYGLFVFDDKREAGNAYDYHQIGFVENSDWDRVDLSGHWCVVLVDHNPGPRRKVEIRRLAQLADYIVVHDTDDKNDWYYKYSEVYPLFRYRYDTKIYPRTTVLSNLKDLSSL
jgi:hypothetical protein